MEKIELEVSQANVTLLKEDIENQVWELNSLQLALVGGGSGDVTLV